MPLRQRLVALKKLAQNATILRKTEFPSYAGFTVTDTGSNWTVGSSLVPTKVTVSNSNPGIATTASVARQTGLALITQVKSISTFGGSTVSPGVVWATERLGTDLAKTEGLVWNTGEFYSLRFTTGAVTIIDTDVTATADIAYRVALVLRSAGMWMIVGNTIAWFTATSSNTPLYAQVISVGANRYPPEVGYVKIAQLGGLFTSDYGLCVDALLGTRSAGETFNHTSDCFIRYTVTTLPTGANVIDVKLRIQDVDNYWYVRVTNTGALALYEVVATVHTQRATTAAAVANGSSVIILAVGTRIRAYTVVDSTVVERWNYATATNFATMTTGKLEAIGDGVVDNIFSVPRTLPSPAQEILGAI